MTLNRYTFFCSEWAEREFKCNEGNFKEAFTWFVKEFGSTFIPIFTVGIIALIILISIRPRINCVHIEPDEVDDIADAMALRV